jgi:hypothetical protein
VVNCEKGYKEEGSAEIISGLVSVRNNDFIESCSVDCLISITLTFNHEPGVE